LSGKHSLDIGGFPY